MPFSLPEHWVWDFWIADDGDRFHLYYLHAPMSLGDPHLRHRNARIGHAVSTDLRAWHDLGPCLGPSGGDAVDAHATWTGSVVPSMHGGWILYSTGSRFLRPDEHDNIETVTIATSPDLHSWTKRPALSLSADPALYETLGHSVWPEEAWRDPWVMRSPAGDEWWMLLTARSRHGADELDRGVVGLAVSHDQLHWRAVGALSEPGAGFKHLEVPQVIDIEGRRVLLFSCDTAALAGARAVDGARGGIWAVEMDEHGCVDARDAQLVVDDSLYAGRAVQDRDGRWHLMAFRNLDDRGQFVGGVTDPLPLRWSSAEGRLVVDVEQAVVA